MHVFCSAISLSPHPTKHVQATDTSAETLTKSQKTSVHPSISHNIRAPKLQRICQASGSSTVSNAQNGLRVSTVWWPTAKGARTREGTLVYPPSRNAEL